MTLDICLNKGALKKGCPNARKSQVIALLVSWASFIVSVCFSGQIIANLLVKKTSESIKSLEDLAKRPEITVITWENANFHQFLLRTNNGKGLINKLDARDLSSLDKLEVHRITKLPNNCHHMNPLLFTFQAYKSVLTGDYVVITDTVSHSHLCMVEGAQLEDFYFSPPIWSAQEAYVFPKNRSTILETVYSSFDWVSALGLYKHYLNTMDTLGITLLFLNWLY